MIFDVACAQRYAEKGNASDWVRLYLHTLPWANVKIWRYLRRQGLTWVGPVEVEISQLRRTCGPEDEMRYREDLDYWDEAVTQIAVNLSDPAQVPPLLVCCIGDALVILDGNHRHEAFRRRGWRTCWVLVGSSQGESLLVQSLAEKANRLPPTYAVSD